MIDGTTNETTATWSTITTNKMEVTVNSNIDVAPKCVKWLKPFKRSVLVDLTQTCTKDYNALLKLLECQCKVSGSCNDELKQHRECFINIMGTGVYKGQTDCGEQLKELAKCSLAGRI